MGNSWLHSKAMIVFLIFTILQGIFCLPQGYYDNQVENYAAPVENPWNLPVADAQDLHADAVKFAEKEDTEDETDADAGDGDDKTEDEDDGDKAADDDDGDGDKVDGEDEDTDADA